MVVRKYESSSDFVEFWVKDNLIYVMVTNGDVSLTSQLDHEDADDLRDWLYNSIKKIQPTKSNQHGPTN